MHEGLEVRRTTIASTFWQRYEHSTIYSINFMYGHPDVNVEIVIYTNMIAIQQQVE